MICGLTQGNRIPQDRYRVRHGVDQKREASTGRAGGQMIDSVCPEA